jgi:hypothetical protein
VITRAYEILASLEDEKNPVPSAARPVLKASERLFCLRVRKSGSKKVI